MICDSSLAVRYGSNAKVMVRVAQLLTNGRLPATSRLLTTKLWGVNEAHRTQRPNERLVISLCVLPRLLYRL